MNSIRQLLFLGTGGAAGIPMVGCRCPRCLSLDEKNKRMRPSVLLTINEKKILIDPGPDFRTQALKYGINNLDGVIITHSHYDHIGGLDELRVFYLQNKKNVPILLGKETLEAIQKRLPYLFETKSLERSLTAQFDFHILPDTRGEISFLEMKVKYMTFEQGGIPVNGFRFGNLAYISDIRHYPETIFDDLKGVKILVLSALNNLRSKMHFSLDEAIAFSKRVGAEKTYFTHIGHEVDHETSAKTLPQGFELAFDGLTLNFPNEV